MGAAGGSNRGDVVAAVYTVAMGTDTSGETTSIFDAFLHRLRSGKAGLTRRSYVLFVGPCWLASGISFFYAVYGFGPWLVPFSAQFCDGYTTEARCTVLYPFAVGMVIIGIPLTLLPQHLPRLGVRKVYFSSLILTSLGVALLGVAPDSGNQSLLWIGFSLCCGIGAGAMYLVVLTCNALWFKDIGKAGLGGGLMGMSCGLWGALSSLTAAPLENAFGLAGMLYFNAAVIFVTGLPATFLLTMPSEWPAAEAIIKSIEVEVSSQANAPASAEPNAPTSSKPADPPSTPLLTTSELLGSRRFWLQWLTFVAAFLPGFGIKFLVGTLLDALYQADRSVQDISSFIYIGIYAIARLGAGLSVGPKWPPKTLFLCALSVQSVLLLATAAAVNWSAGGNDFQEYVFVSLITLVGITLAVTKVTFPLMIIYSFGPKNFAVASGGFFSAFCLAAGLGPISAYLTLAAGGSTGSTGSRTVNQQHGAAYWLVICSALSGLAALRTKLYTDQAA